MIRYKDKAAIVWLVFMACLVSGCKMTAKTRLIPLILIVLGISNVSVNGGKANTCTTPGTVTEGDPTAVTCTYHQNLENSRQDFYIYKTQPGSESVIVAICAWEQANLECDLKPGYNVKVQDHTVILNISSVQHSHAGNYSCSALPNERDTPIEECSLSVKGYTAVDKMTIFCNKDGGQASVMCVFPESLGAATVTLERHDLQGTNTKPVEVMRCDKKKDQCLSGLAGYTTIVNTEAENFKTFGVNIPSYAADKGGLFVCKADTESTPYDMCTLNNNEATTRTDPVEESVHELVFPLYAILVCLILLLVPAAMIVFKRCRKNAQNGSSNSASALLTGESSSA